MSDPNSRDSLRSTLVQLAGSIFELFQTRMEIASIELAEEKNRLISVLLVSLAAMLFALMAFITVTALIVLVCWTNYRWQGLIGLSIVYLAAAAFCAVRVRAKLRASQTVFPATLEQFHKDRELFRERD